MSPDSPQPLWTDPHVKALGHVLRPTLLPGAKENLGALFTIFITMSSSTVNSLEAAGLCDNGN
eukprot:1435074-Amphidinium_carterae.1